MRAANFSVVDEHWAKSYWRPAMGWLYMVICACDFVLFPVLHAVIQTMYYDASILTQWNPITLQGAGLVHLAFGAILGIAAWGRSKEKTTFVDADGNTKETELEAK